MDTRGSVGEAHPHINLRRGLCAHAPTASCTRETLGGLFDAHVTSKRACAGPTS